MCPGQTVTWGGSSVTVMGDSSSSPANYEPLACGFPAAGRENVFKLVAPTTGTLKMTVEPTGFAATIYTSKGTCGDGSAGKCSSGVNVGTAVTLDVATTAGATYYLFVDAWTQGKGGPFTMTLTY